MDFSNLLRKLPTHYNSTKGQLLTQSLFPIYIIEGNPSIIIKIITNPKLAQIEFVSLKFLNEKNLLVPLPYLLEEERGSFYLVMEYIESNKSPNSEDFKRTLRNLYSIKSTTWGYHANNFIGSLPQKNNLYKDFYSYFWNSRWEPMIDLAIQKHLLDLKTKEKLEKLLTLSLSWGIGNIEPRLIHGDLWAGNAVWNQRGMYLIDPSLSFGHPEQDLAMAQLFGGFPSSAFSGLLESLGLDPSGFPERIPFWQIYPLLVHINLFGSSYVSSFNNALSRYSLV